MFRSHGHHLATTSGEAAQHQRQGKGGLALPPWVPGPQQPLGLSQDLQGNQRLLERWFFIIFHVLVGISRAR